MIIKSKNIPSVKYNTAINRYDPFARININTMYLVTPNRKDIADTIIKVDILNPTTLVTKEVLIQYTIIIISQTIICCFMYKLE